MSMQKLTCGDRIVQHNSTEIFRPEPRVKMVSARRTETGDGSTRRVEIRKPT